MSQPDDEELEATAAATARRGAPRVVVRVGNALLSLSFEEAEDLRDRLRLLQAVSLVTGKHTIR